MTDILLVASYFIGLIGCGSWVIFAVNSDIDSEFFKRVDLIIVPICAGFALFPIINFLVFAAVTIYCFSAMEKK